MCRLICYLILSGSYNNRRPGLTHSDDRSSQQRFNMAAGEPPICCSKLNENKCQMIFPERDFISSPNLITAADSHHFLDLKTHFRALGLD
ncbi:hypothetical protein CEXT_547681 [Caerostris extrusa]|uniref:Uncharacterized protein n=1 Tax=Caerostris extrusa TaxID=172846 RepID=A0AAV4N6C1_CAEEX|nr:hypothetical protein CEXT_547681 [Caerostris extrusa]